MSYSTSNSVSIPVSTLRCVQWKNLKAYSRVVFITMLSKEPLVEMQVRWNNNELVIETGLPRRTVERAISELKERGFVNVYRAGGKWQNDTVYDINPLYLIVSTPIQLSLAWKPQEYHNPRKHWLWIREQVLQRDANACVECGNQNDLQVHHLTYENEGNETTDELITLCVRCHGKYPGRKKYTSAK